MSNTLPLTVQDDIQAKERYSAQQQQRNAGRSCNSRRIRLWTLILIVSISTLLFVKYFKVDSMMNKDMILPENDDIINAPLDEKEPLTLKQEIMKQIQSHQLIVFSKTYCPFSKKAKDILSAYELKDTLEVIEVDLRDDDYQVKMVLQEISGRSTFPNIFLNGKTLGGSDDLEELHETGQLAVLLKDNQLLL